MKIRTWFIISQKKNRIVSIQWWGLGTSVRNSTGQRVQPQLAIPPWASLPRLYFGQNSWCGLDQCFAHSVNRNASEERRDDEKVCKRMRLGP